MKKSLAHLIVILTFSISAIAQCSDTDKKALEAFDHAWGTASVGGDRAALTNIYADDYVGLPGMQGKAAAIDAAMKSAERNKANPAGADKVSYDHYLITCTPNSATITHRNAVWTPNGSGGKPESFYTRSVHFLEKRGGKWQVVSNAGNGLDDFSTIWYLEQDWNDASPKRDRAWFEKNYADDFSSVSSVTGKLSNKADDIADTMNDKGTVDLTETTDMNIRVDGGTAIVTGVYRTKGKDEKGVAYDRKIRFTDTWVKRDGRWQAWATAGAIIPTLPEVAKAP
jgi:Ketosteroid isomerase homolog